MGLQVTLLHQRKTRQHKSWHLKETQCHAKIHPIRYQTYRLTRIQIQVCQILLHQSRLTHQTTSILNEDDVQKRKNINSWVKRVSMTQSNITWSLHPSYLQMRKNQRSLSLNCTRTHYSAGFIFYTSWIHLTLYYHNFQKHTYCLWTIEFPDYAKNSTWNLLHVYIYAHSQRLIDEYIGDGVQYILILQYQCANMTFPD